MNACPPKKINPVFLFARNVNLGCFMDVNENEKKFNRNRRSR
jgi:hypothetical protein